MVFVPTFAKSGSKMLPVLTPGPVQPQVPPPMPPVTVAWRVIGVVLALRQMGGTGVMLMVAAGQSCATQVTWADMSSQGPGSSAITWIVTSSPGFRPVNSMEVSEVAVPVPPFITFTSKPLEPGILFQKNSMVFVVVTQVICGAGRSSPTSTVWVIVLEEQPSSSTISEMVYVPPVGQVTWSGPGPVAGLAVPPLKFQVKVAELEALPV